MRKSKDSKAAGNKQGGANPWRQYRKTPSLPENVRSFQLGEKDGIKILEERSNDTATVIRCEGPVLELELIQAMTYCQGSAAKAGCILPVATIRSKFPMISKYCDDGRVQAITRSEAGVMNARKEAVSILAEKLQINPRTVERYFRKPTTNKDTKEE
jgi:hypothetical protein